MKYIINYTKEGKILGFTKGDTDLNIEVSNAIWFEAQSFNKIIINGKDISFDKVDWRTAEEINDIRIQQIEAKCNQAIESVYPIYKQINITNLLTPYTEEDRETMKAFIDSKRSICHKAITDGTKAEDINWEITTVLKA
ncbi:hypothetical protein L5F35_03870 [Aliarcobacter butzleri]|uniref:hypothetical protein n=1 Tax=Aliarcobacter butzleri TaxID=28197 RepID=UPI001EDA9C53|nr:hypothetical protein [Aliarcobacter butzleri]MCG3685348.1 hypothetical protein [Aliarcobacter butzleri]